MSASSPRPGADIVMLGTFGVWKRGTLQSRALPLARALHSATGLQVAIVTTPWDAPEDVGRHAVHDSIRIYNTRTTRPAGAALAAAEQLRLTRALRPRIVHLMKPKGFGGLAAGARRLLPERSRLIVDYDDWEGDGGWNDSGGYGVAARRLFAFQETSLIRAADAVTAASTLLDERARRLRPGRSDCDVTYLPNGLDPDWLRQLSSARPSVTAEYPSVLLYSRFAEFSIGWLRAFLSRLDGDLDSPVRFELIGEFDPATLAGLELRKIEMHAHGFVERERIPALLAAAAVALFPYEDTLINRAKQSVKLLELMAAGRAVVACDVGDIARIAGDAVDLSPSNAPACVAARVQRLLVDEPRRGALGARARERAARFTTDRLALRLLDAYRHVGLAA